MSTGSLIRRVFLLSYGVLRVPSHGENEGIGEGVSVSFEWDIKLPLPNGPDPQSVLSVSFAMSGTIMLIRYKFEIFRPEPVLTIPAF